MQPMDEVLLTFHIQNAGMTVSAAPLVIRGNVISPPQLAFSPNVGVSLVYLAHCAHS